MLLPQAEDRAVIVCDKPGGGHKDEDAWIERTLALTDHGMQYVRADNVVLPILTAPSHHHPHLQLADLVVGSVTAAVAGVSYGLDLVPQVTTLLHRSPRGGVIAGTGLKLFPNDLWNVYHWAIGETAVLRQGWSLDLPTPTSTIPRTTESARWAT